MMHRIPLLILARRGFARTPAPAGAGPGGPEPDLFDLNFDGYNSTAELRSDADTFLLSEDNDIGEIELTTDEVAPGHTKSMRYHYFHEGDGCNSITIRRAIRFTPQQEVWAEFLLKWSPNFRTTNDLCAPNDHKLIFGDTLAGSNGRWAFYVGADSGPSHSVQVETPWRIVGSSHEPRTGLIGGYYPNLPHPTPLELWQSDAWHTIRLYLRSATSNGAYKAWIDGQLIHDESGFGAGDVDDSPDLIEGFSWCHNKDEGPAQEDMYIWWGHVKVWSSNPGW